jgi:hypothetical protein
MHEFTSIVYIKYIIIYRKRQALGTKLGQDDFSHRVRSTWYVYNTCLVFFVNVRSTWSKTVKGLNRITEIGQCQLYRREENHSLIIITLFKNCKFP